MDHPRRAFMLARWALPLATTGAALAVNAAIPGVHEAHAILFLAAVTVSTWYGGVGPGMLATGLSVVLLDYFFVGKIYSIDLGVDVDIELVAFVLAAMLINSLNLKRRRLEAALRLQNRRKSEFMAVLAHELRNFLSPMTPSVAVLASRTEGDTVAERTCRTLERQVVTMSRLVNDLLDTARIEEGKALLAIRTVDLGAIVRQSIEAVRPLLDQRRHRLEASLPEFPLLIEGDATRLEQVFVNLLRNAAQYTEPGGRIIVQVDSRPHEVRVAVRDDGRGLPADLLPRVFDLFAQADAGALGGLGIGLSLVRGLVELHGGRVTAHSDGPGHGSEFAVRLPRPGAALGRERATGGRVERSEVLSVAPAAGFRVPGLRRRAVPSPRVGTPRTPSLPR